jgi:hypothetical protein
VFNGDTPASGRPPTSSINWSSTTEVIANSLTVAVGSTGRINVYTQAAADVVIDVIGYHR